ncbi:MAG: ATP-grasp domain-containing protein [Bacteroidetes bacterium 4572_117]|nr:MAG: ATP-grasp domain-containing protein [Bacteroidetes bacterium 4572_117]
MIILDKPYVSDFLIQTVIKYKMPVLKTEFSLEILNGNKELLITEEEAILQFKNNETVKLYTNSENSISWIEKNLKFTNLPEKVKIFKDKVQFREFLIDLYPDYFFKGIHLNDLESTDVSDFPLPFILKPAIGFFSMGVYKIDHHNDWEKAVIDIKKEIGQIKGLYPEEVLNTTKFIVEECIIGEEYAIDCYYDNNGKPVILNILKHLFSSDKDTSDRVYITSTELIKENLEKIEQFLSETGKLSDVKNFPVHVEIRIDQGKIQPIEFNPLRFGGWCTTADITNYAFGINSYEYYQSSLKPNWEQIFKENSGNIYSVIVLDNSSGIEGKNISSFDYDKLQKNFEKPLELRKANYRKFPVFGFLFAETRKENLQELEYILKSDLREFIS